MFGAIDTNTVTEITTGLESFGTSLLDNFVDLLPALAGIAAILFVINIIRRKVRS